MPDVITVLESLRSTDPTRPRLTWYGPDGERVEFSGKVLDNWVAKTANLLVDELDVVDGDSVGIALPVHWRSVVWWLAAWAAGADARHGEDDVDVLVTDSAARAAAAPSGVRLAVLALPALATRWPGDLPAGALDATADTRLQPDVYVPVVRPAGEAPVADARRLATGRGLTSSSRVLLSAADPDPLAWLAPLVAGGSVVLHHALETLPPDARAKLERDERTTP